MQPAAATSQIFYVDDDADDRLLMGEAFLEYPSLELITFDSGSALLQALADAGDQLPALVILDINMPAMDGLEVLANMRSQPALVSLPAIVFTNSVLGSEKQIAQDLEAYFLTKPMNYRQLQEAIVRMLAYCAAPKEPRPGKF